MQKEKTKKKRKEKEGLEKMSIGSQDRQRREQFQDKPTCMWGHSFKVQTFPPAGTPIKEEEEEASEEKSQPKPEPEPKN